MGRREIRDVESQDDNPFANARGGSGAVNTRIADRKSDYQKRWHDRLIRKDGISYKDTMLQSKIEKERDKLIHKAKKDMIELKEQD